MGDEPGRKKHFQDSPCVNFFFQNVILFNDERLYILFYSSYYGHPLNTGIKIFSVSLSVMILRIEFVIYSQINSNEVFVWAQVGFA